MKTGFGVVAIVVALLLLSGTPARAQGREQANGRPDAQIQQRIDDRVSGAQPDAPRQARPGELATGDFQLEGNIAEAAPLAREVTILDPRTGQLLTLDVVADTGLRVGGRPAQLGDLRPGAEVRATYEEREGAMIARNLDVSAGGAKSPAVLRPASGERPARLAVRGTILDKSERNRRVKVLDPDRDLVVSVRVAPGSKLTRGAEPIAFEALEAGDEARVTYEVRGADRLARTVAISARADEGGER